MSISSTRKVSSSTGSQTRNSPVKHTDHNYLVGSEGESFVEVIDASNNISVNNNERDDSSKNKQSYEQPEKDNSSNLNSAPTYIRSAIEALSASGVYDEEQEETHNNNKVNVYGNNQSIVRDEEVERTGHNYLKHFYETNQPIEEIDELV